LIDCQSETLYFADGEYRLAPPFAGRESYEFPHPFGRRPQVHHAHEEHSTLPRWLPKLGDKGLAFLDFKMGASDAALDSLKAVIDSGMASPTPRLVKGTMVRPIDVLVSSLPPSAPPERIAELARAGKIIDEGVYAIDLHTEADGPPVESFYIFSPWMREVTERCPGANRISHCTSAAAAVYVGYILDGTIGQRGVLPPEGLERQVRLKYIDDLKNEGFRFVRRTSRWL
jgi:saccharopine dehydrogenase-like NADP-dependent oxidoreductase